MSEIQELLAKIHVWQEAERTYMEAYSAYSYDAMSLELASQTEITKDALDAAAIDAFDVRHNTERLHVAVMLADEIERLQRENAQLQARIARAMSIGRYIVDSFYDGSAGNDMRDEFRAALSEPTTESE